jgi:hypothetical protein
MGGNNSIAATVVQTINNNSLQVSTASCSFTSNQEQSGNTVIIAPGARTGNIRFSQTSTFDDTSCVINQNIETSVTNILTSAIDQASFITSGILPRLGDNVNLSANITQTMTNNLQQLISTTCNIGNNQVMNGNYVFVGTGARTGDIEFIQNSSITNSECVLDVSAKLVAVNEADADIKQRATTLDVCTMIFLIIGLVCILGFLLAFVFLIGGGTKAISEKINENKNSKVS